MSCNCVTQDLERPEFASIREALNAVVSSIILPVPVALSRLACPCSQLTRNFFRSSKDKGLEEKDEPVCFVEPRFRRTILKERFGSEDVLHFLKKKSVSCMCQAELTELRRGSIRYCDRDAGNKAIRDHQNVVFPDHETENVQKQRKPHTSTLRDE